MERTLQPNSNHCFVCGMRNQYGLKLRFYTRENGEVVSRFAVPEQYQGYPGVVHGGIVAAMLDEAAGRSHMSQVDEEGNQITRFMFTMRLDIRYRKNVPVNHPLKLVGKPGKSKGHTAQAHSFIYDDSDNLLAEAEALLMDVPEDVLGGVDLEKLGWKVYLEGETVG